MKRRGRSAEEIPERLLHFRLEDWPVDTIEDADRLWTEARRAWRAAHPPRTLGELNRWYASDVVWPPQPDPRRAVNND